MTLSHLYDRFITALAVSGAASLVLITIAIIIDVILRNTGFRPSQATSAIVEYVMLYATVTGSPWLVRQGGHVAITAFVEALPNGLRWAAGQLVLVLSAGVLGLLCWRAGAVGLEMAAAGAVDMRSINIPSWVLYAMLSGGFDLMMLEFLRLLWRGEVYAADRGAH